MRFHSLWRNPKNRTVKRKKEKYPINPIFWHILKILEFFSIHSRYTVKYSTLHSLLLVSVTTGQEDSRAGLRTVAFSALIALGHAASACRGFMIRVRDVLLGTDDALSCTYMSINKECSVSQVSDNALGREIRSLLHVCGLHRASTQAFAQAEYWWLEQWQVQKSAVRDTDVIPVKHKKKTWVFYTSWIILHFNPGTSSITKLQYLNLAGKCFYPRNQINKS